MTSLGHSVDGHALSKRPAFALSCCHQHSSPGVHLTLVDFPGIWSKQRVMWPDARKAPRGPTAWSMQIMCLSDLSANRQGPLPTVPPSHHSTSPPSWPAGQPRRSPTAELFLSSLLPSDCLEVSALCQRFVKTRIFLFLFSHHSIVILRSLMDQ